MGANALPETLTGWLRKRTDGLSHCQTRLDPSVFTGGGLSPSQPDPIVSTETVRRSVSLNHHEDPIQLTFICPKRGSSTDCRYPHLERFE